MRSRCVEQILELRIEAEQELSCDGKRLRGVHGDGERELVRGDGVEIKAHGGKGLLGLLVVAQGDERMRPGGSELGKRAPRS